MSPLLHFVENELQLAALAFLAAVYVVRIGWLLGFPSPRPRTWPAGNVGAAVGRSLLAVARPSTRRWGLYLEFVVFHLGVAVAIAASFAIPYWPEVAEDPGVAGAAQLVLAAASLAGISRAWRRGRDRGVREVTTPDDVLSLVLTTAFCMAAALALQPGGDEGPRLLFFLLTAAFLVYVPFSKVGHYLYYPFTRVFRGRSLGHRAVYPQHSRFSPRLDGAGRA